MESNTLTILIKTFERPEMLHALLDSVRYRRLVCPIVIADDSATPCREQILAEYPELSIVYLELPFDVGLSKGRNAALDRVETEYFLLCDDDFRFDRRADLDAALNLLENNNLDILGGVFFEYPVAESHFRRLLQKFIYPGPSGYRWNFIGQLNLSASVLKARIRLQEFPEFAVVDFCHNFFIARTAKVREMGGWPEAIKTGEHLSFFLKAKMAGLKVGTSSLFGIGHYPVRNKRYGAFRRRNYQLEAFHTFGYTQRIKCFDNGETSTETLTDNGIVQIYRFQKTLRGQVRRLSRFLQQKQGLNAPGKS